MDLPNGQNPVLDIGGSQQKGAGSVFQGGGSQIAGAEIRRDPPNLTPGRWCHVAYRTFNKQRDSDLLTRS